jgi:hypothetical protein
VLKKWGDNEIFQISDCRLQIVNCKKQNKELRKRLPRPRPGPGPVGRECGLRNGKS